MEVTIQPNERHIQISELGLDINIKPNYLIHQLLDESGRYYLKNILIEKLDAILEKLTRDYTNISEGICRPETKALVENKEKQLASIAEFALFVRQIAPLSMQLDLEFEFESKSAQTKKAIEWAYSIFQYSDLYGYRQTIKGSVKL
jgi:hypothetical protein